MSLNHYEMSLAELAEYKKALEADLVAVQDALDKSRGLSDDAFRARFEAVAKGIENELKVVADEMAEQIADDWADTLTALAEDD